MIYIVSIISLFLDGIFSNFISFNILSATYFRPLFSLIALILIYPYFDNEDTKYYIFSFILGMFYDMLYGNTFIVNAVLFLIIGFIIRTIYMYFSNNVLNNLIIATICITIYGICNFFIYYYTNKISFNLFYLYNFLKSSLIINYLYLTIYYIFLKYLNYKYKIRYLK